MTKKKDAIFFIIADSLLQNKRHRGKTVSCLAAPAQIPACGITALGFSEVFASAKALSSTRGDAHKSAFGAIYDKRFCNVKLFHQLIEAKPIFDVEYNGIANNISDLNATLNGHCIFPVASVA